MATLDEDDELMLVGMMRSAEAASIVRVLSTASENVQSDTAFWGDISAFLSAFAETADQIGSPVLSRNPPMVPHS